jgi:hypothetical protein
MLTLKPQQTTTHNELTMSSRTTSSHVTIEPAPTAKRSKFMEKIRKVKRLQKLSSKRGGSFGTAAAASINQTTTTIANTVIFEVQEPDESKVPEKPANDCIFTPGCAGCQGVGYQHHITRCRHHNC